MKTYKEEGKTLSYVDLSRSLNLLKKLPIEEGGVPWMYEVSSVVPLDALRNLDHAYDMFFKRCREISGNQKGYPKFKSKKSGGGSFSLRYSIRVSKSRIQLPRIGSIKLKEKEYLPLYGREDIKVLSAAISEKAGRWYVSLRVEQEIPDPILVKDEDKHVVGVDVGVKTLAVTSDGEIFENPKAFVKAQKKLRMLDKAVARKKKGSKNQKKALKKRAKHYQKIASIRRDNQQKASTAITKSADVIVVESLNVKGMRSNRHLSKAISDVGMTDFLRQLEYKALWLGKQFVKADRWYPSSKTCSNCGSIKAELSLGERTFNCGDCGFSIDRDLNAAINLKNLAGSSPVSACCPVGSTSVRNRPKRPPVGQEPNSSSEG
ncbi:MAG: transposase [Kiritimatiellae bacterium]|nr:transposase [Kiritimatiellia bacterium]